jgi:uncharacterized membrane protein YwaF
VFFYTQLVALFVGLVNYAVGANYMYLAEKPAVYNPFIIGNWPWYILGLEVAVLLHFYVIYILFRQRTPRLAKTAVA